MCYKITSLHDRRLWLWFYESIFIVNFKTLSNSLYSMRVTVTKHVSGLSFSYSELVRVQHILLTLNL